MLSGHDRGVMRRAKGAQQPQGRDRQRKSDLGRRITLAAGLAASQRVDRGARRVSIGFAAMGSWPAIAAVGWVRDWAGRCSGQSIKARHGAVLDLLPNVRAASRTRRPRGAWPGVRLIAMRSTRRARRSASTDRNRCEAVIRGRGQIANLLAAHVVCRAALTVDAAWMFPAR